MQTYNIQTAPFQELVAMPTASATHLLFDIIIEEEINLITYCNALFKKIFELPQSQFPDFINYQCSKVKNAFSWLNKLEKLIALNEEIFDNQKAKSRYIKLYNIIENKRKEVKSAGGKEGKSKTPKKYINAESEERYFSYQEVKQHLNILKEDGEKILYLTTEQYAFQQTNIEFINQKLPPFDEQCKKEIEQIYALRKLKNDLQKEQQQSISTELPYNKIKINIQVNQFVDLFYQLHRELFIAGKPMIEGSINDITAIIIHSFVDKDGKEFSPETIKTILSPSKTDKRPKPHKRLDISKLL